MSLVPDLAAMVERFNREIIGLPIPSEPQRLSTPRKEFALTAMQEELDEYRDTDSIDEEADALIDLTYFALGRLIEMGIAPRPVFEEVHAANMRKRRGELSKRPNAMGHDAIKPEGWKAPDLRPLLGLPSRDKVLPKLLVLGYGRHGKDTVSEMLRDLYGMRFTSSSQFCAERVMMPHFDKMEDGPVYLSPKDCFDDRHHHRQAWYEAIRDFNRPDPTALARAILEENDVYCGMRSKAELHACKNTGVFDHIIWVDASDRGIPPESHTSCTVEPWMADYVIDNGGTVEDLMFNVGQLMKRLMP